MKKRLISAVICFAAVSYVTAGCGRAALDEAEAPAVSASPSDSEPAVLSFSDEQVHTGDLILVNAGYGYDFGANASLSIVKIRDAQSFSYPLSKEEFQAAEKIIPYLDEMIRDCNEAMGTEVTSISSAWRSREYQQNVWDEMEELYGEEYAKKYVAVPGFSEHHTGLAVDLGIIYSDGSEGTFSESANAGWMAENSWRYGFVRRYAEDKREITGISNEAWHFRYVGLPHAAYMFEHNLCLEEYLDYLKNETSMEDPLTVSAGGRTWTVFYTEEREIPAPEGEVTASGDNRGGIIVTE